MDFAFMDFCIKTVYLVSMIMAWFKRCGASVCSTLVVCCALISSDNVLAQRSNIQFQRLDMSDGLSHHMVNDIYKDRQGFMWFATSSGLNRYDGYTVRVFRNIPSDTSSLLVDDVRQIFEGPDDQLWILTNAGNAVYDFRTERFQRNTGSILRKLKVAQGLITSVTPDHDGNYWFVHYNQGLFRYNSKTKSTTRLFPATGDSTTILTAQLSAVSEDPEGNLWVVHQNGLLEKIDKKTLKVVYRNHAIRQRFRGQSFDYKVVADRDGDIWIFNDRNFGCFVLHPRTGALENFNTSSRVRLSSDIVKEIVQDDNGLIWIGTDHGGVNIFDKASSSMRYVVNDEDDVKSISENSIQSLYKDRDGIIWIGSYNYGVSYYHENIFRFRLYTHHRNKPGGLPFNDINAFAEDRKGNIWIGTDGGGLIRFDQKRNVYEQFVNKPGDPNSLSNDVIVSLYVDKEDILWIGTYYGGLNRFDGKRFTRFKHDPSNLRSLGDDNVWEIMEDSDNNLWIGTLKRGVDVFDRKKNEFIHYAAGSPNSIHTNYVDALLEDRDGNIWVGTGYGLEVLDKQSGRFSHYLNDMSDEKSISDNGVLCLLQDSRGMIWVGTQGGLNLYDPVTRGFKTFLEKDGLHHNTILTMVEDNDGAIWMSTPKGLSQLKVTANNECVFKNYDQSDGLMNGAFHLNAALKTSAGELLFGGSNGFNIFDPAKVRFNEGNSKVVLTDFQLFNRSVKIGEEFNDDVILDRAISTVENITASHVNNVLSIEFSALNFFHPQKTQYRYILEGFNQDWLTTDANQRKVTFTNLDPGNYTFKVKASHGDGVWGDEATTLHITVLPPFWKSSIAFVCYAMLIVAALVIVRTLIVRRERMNFRVQQEKLEAQRMHELDEMKIKFFTNVSHEFRTPLSLILAPMENMLQTSTPDQRTHLQVIQRNAKRLLNLVNQLLDFRKVEIEEVKLSTSEGDIVTFIRELVHSFSDVSKQKNIALNFRSTIPSFETNFDQDKIEKIIFNLLSNAFKFTLAGTVEVELSEHRADENNYLRIDVTDTGIGIPKDKQSKVFDRFYQNELNGMVANEGNGIGLSIVNEFVKAHGGFMSLVSEPMKGSCFSVFLPLARVTINMDLSEEEARANGEGHGEKPTLLLVEDNNDFRFYLKDQLVNEYTVLEAENGNQGLKKALHAIPDLIISDVMMPGMDGVQLCKELKSDRHTSHIPIILLTARHSSEQKIQGFEFGADDYITKPFNFEILQSRIRNLIHQRQLFQQHFQKHFSVKASEVQITSLDEKFIKSALETVERNLANADFSVEELSKLMGMSRVLLYKKLLSLTGKSPIEFIRSIRLQRAAQLLEKSQCTVSEIAYQVGFNNPKYFAKYFKEEYHILPSAYAASKKTKSDQPS
jgi:signal transduction histidine kinase/ligand-binding sensor domain-containing protein/DNA-binding response OmpR family regulator